MIIDHLAQGPCHYKRDTKNYPVLTVGSNNRLLSDRNSFSLRCIFIVIKAQKIDVSAKKLSLWVKASPHSHTYFFAPFRLSASSRSRCASSLARCCTRFSAAVIRGTISSNGFSNIRMVLIFGGL
jgi:hypothetical protein